MPDLYGLDAQAAQVRARLREGEVIHVEAWLDREALAVEVSLVGGGPLNSEPVRFGAPDLENALRSALAWLEKRDAEGGR